MMRAERLRRVVVALLIYLPIAPAAVAREPKIDLTGWHVSLGAFDIIDSDKTYELGLEYRFKPRRIENLPLPLRLTPMVGVSAADGGNYWVYVGLRYDYIFARRWIISPNFATSFYEDGNGKNLGGLLEFRSGLELAYQFADGSKIGLQFYHLSNGRLYAFNPGSESLVMTVSW